jgi:protein-S-isoprenylcysteine O-methyltransferase Ste14
MRLKGFHKFRVKVPWFSGNRIFLLPVYALLMLALAIAVLIILDTMPDKYASSGMAPITLALFPLLGELVVGLVGLLLVAQMWIWRSRLKARYGPISYERIFPAGVAGVAFFILALSINLFIPYWSYSPSFWAVVPMRWLATPIEAYLASGAPAVFWIRILLTALFSVTGIVMFVRSLQTFGFDYMTVVYLYFPEESQIQDHQIYSVLRHPAYAGALILGLGGMFYTFTAYSVVLWTIYLLGFYCHVHFVEEPELIQRFGPSYKDYRDSVPAFFVKPSKLGTLLTFLRRTPAAS